MSRPLLRQLLFAIGDILVAHIESVADLYETIQVRNAEFDWGKTQVAVDDLPDTDLVAFALDGSIGDGWRRCKRRQIDRNLGQFTHRRQRLWDGIEDHFSQHFLCYCICLGLYAQHPALQCRCGNAKRCVPVVLRSALMR